MFLLCVCACVYKIICMLQIFYYDVYDVLHHFSSDQSNV